MKLKSIGIGLLVVVILFIGIRVFTHFVSNKEYVEVPLIVPDTIYQDIETKRDSLQLVIDSILNALNNTNQYEKEFDASTIKEKETSLSKLNIELDKCAESLMNTTLHISCVKTSQS